MSQPADSSVQQLLNQKFELELDDEVRNEAELFEQLSQRIGYMIDHKLEFLLSLMYRMDINEARVRQALAPNAAEPPHIGLAKLVWERAQQRKYTKEHVKVKPLDDIEEDLKW